MEFETNPKRGILINSGEFPHFTGLSYLETLIRPNSIVHVVCEGFALVSVSVNVTPIEVIGAVKFWICDRANLNMMLHLQAPGERVFVEKRFSKPFPFVKNHARSALLHCMCYMYKHMGEVVTYTNVR